MKNRVPTVYKYNQYKRKVLGTFIDADGCIDTNVLILYVIIAEKSITIIWEGYQKQKMQIL